MQRRCLSFEETLDLNMTNCSLSLQILCFDAFFQEDVSDSIIEQKRIRMFKIYFYLKDGTIQVVEPKCKNSGIHQGMCDKTLVNEACSQLNVSVAKTDNLTETRWLINTCNSPVFFFHCARNIYSPAANPTASPKQ